MLTSIQGAFDRERSYDAISNTINSSVISYRPIKDMKNDAKSLVEDSADTALDANTIQEAMSKSNKLMDTIESVVQPAYVKMSSNKSSRSTESFAEFMHEAWAKFKKLMMDLIDAIVAGLSTIISYVQQFNTIVYKFFKTKISAFIQRFSKSKINSSKTGDIPVTELFKLHGITELMFPNVSSSNMQDPSLKRFIESSGYGIKLRVHENANEYFERLAVRSNSLYRYVESVIGHLMLIIDNSDADKAVSILENCKLNSSDDIKKFNDLFVEGDVSIWSTSWYGIDLSTLTLQDLTGEVHVEDDLLYHGKDNGSVYISGSANKIVLPVLNNTIDVPTINQTLKTYSDVSNKVAMKPVEVFGDMLISEVNSLISDNYKMISDTIDAMASDKILDINNSLVKVSAYCKKSLETFRRQINTFSSEDSVDSTKRLCTIILSQVYTCLNNSVIGMSAIINSDVIARHSYGIECSKVYKYIMQLFDQINTTNIKEEN